MSTFLYQGTELDLFSGATNWKQYVRSRIAPYLGKDVLEVGAGFGGSTRILVTSHTTRWLCVEPDSVLAARLHSSIVEESLPEQCELLVGPLRNGPPDETFDSILYLDVLEHIEDDASEVQQALRHLRPGGCLIVLCPAHQFLFSPFDGAIGHFRRYNKAMFRALSTANLRLVTLHYLDSVGLLASLANRFLLRHAMPSEIQIRVWDRCMVPLSRVVDPLLAFTLGKSVLGVWKYHDTSVAGH